MTQDQTPAATGSGEPTPVVLPDQAEMTIEQLARAILARQIIRPRITSVRRLAEAVLAKGGKKKGKGKDKKKAAHKKTDKAVRKLALIPGQKGR